MITIRVVLLAAIGLAINAIAHGAQAQGATSLPRIAFLSSDGPLSPTCTSSQPHVGIRAFLDGVHALGYREGENVAIDCRSASGKYERLDALAAELVQLYPAVLVASATPASLAAKRATSNIP